MYSVVTKRHKKTRQIMEVMVRYLSVEGVETRLTQAIDLLLKSAAMNTDTSQAKRDSRKEELPYHGTDESRQRNTNECSQ